MIRLFTGYDYRESVGWHVFVQSVIDHTSLPVQICPLNERVKSDGTNAFSLSRFLIPSLCEFRGFAIFADGADMLARADLADLWALRDVRYAVQVVKRAYEPRHPRKYIGTSMEADNPGYPCKNWSSLVIWNCGHPDNAMLTEQRVGELSGKYLHRFSWTEAVGALPPQWNQLDEFGMGRETKLMHYTNGIPAFTHYRDAPYAGEWRSYLLGVLNGQQ